jgi:IS5 family transposase
VQCPKQRNTRKENELIKEGKTEKIEGWSDAKARQKDTDAKWKSKNNKNYFGYENHIQTDVKHKFIRDYQVTDASVHDSQVFEELIDPNNTSKDVYADSAYGAKEKRQMLEKQGYNGKIQFKGARNHPLTQNKLNGNKTRAKVRARVEHIFGIMSKRMKSTILYGIGLLRANNRIGLRNLAYNITRYVYLAK